MLACLDFETYYDKDFSLSKITTEAYIRDPRFEVIGVSLAVGDAAPVWFSGTWVETHSWLNKQVKWDETLLLAHNCAFDAAILNWHFGIKPKGYLDTLSLANALYGVNESVSLKSLAERYQLPAKGTEVLTALGKRRRDFSPAELAAYGEYCKHDTWLCRSLFDLMAPQFTKAELRAVDLTIRMFAEPILELDLPLLEEHLINTRQDQRESLSRLTVALSADCEADVKTVLMSNQKFASLLEYLGVDVPMKVSATTGKEAPAFAKTDEAFQALLEHENPVVQAAVAARLGNKSTIEESRTEAFIEIAKRGTLPVPLKYSGAAVTHRWSGGDGLNLQNLPRGGKLREAIRAPKGFKIVSADLSNIELRLGLYMAGQDDKVQLIRDGVDLYMDVATGIYGKTYEEIKELGKKSKERTVSKVLSLSCIAEGSLVLTPRGLVPIEKIQLDDHVWDGLEWVRHDGVIYQGERDVITYQNLTATADHKVWTEKGWNISLGGAKSRLDTLAITGDGRTAVRFVGDREFRSAAKGQAYRCAGSMLVWADRVAQLGQHASRVLNPMPYLLYAVAAKATRIFSGRHQSQEAVTKTSERYISEMQQPQRSRLCELWSPWNTMPIQNCEAASGLHYRNTSVGELCPSTDRPNKQRGALRNREYASSAPESKCVEQTIDRIYLLARAKSTCRRVAFALRYYTDLAVRAPGIHRRGDNSTGLENGFRKAEKLAGHKTKARVYDIINAGPRHRFTVSGVLVSNCIYGTGAAKLKDTLRIQGKVKVSQEEAQRMTDLYRETYTRVVASWNEGREVLDALYAKENYGEYLRPGVLQVTKEGIMKPSGLLLAYPDLRWTKGEDGKMGYTYEQKRKSRDRVYGSKCYQRCIQALARDIICEHMLKIDKKYRVVGTVHDEIICLVADAEVDDAKAYMLEVMRTPPAWSKALPLDAEVEASSNYGGAH